MTEAFTTMDEIDAAREAIEGRIDGYEAPAAFGLGVATIADNGDVLDVSFPHVQASGHSFPAAALAQVAGHSSGTATYHLSSEQIAEALSIVEPALTVDVPHPNAAAWNACAALAEVPAAGGATPHRGGPSLDRSTTPRSMPSTGTCASICCRIAWFSPTA